jgi:hypothetical protein
MGTKNNPGLHDCYIKAEPDEPMFILLARDKHAPALVWLWASLRELDGASPSKANEARVCAANMMAWAHDHDLPVVGFGHAALAGTMELIRAVNSASKRLGENYTNSMTDIDAMRMFLSETEFEPSVPCADGGEK